MTIESRSSTLTFAHGWSLRLFAPFGDFADDCKVVDSRVPMPDVPGVGFEAKNALYAVMKEMLSEGFETC